MFGDATGVPAPATLSTPGPRHADNSDEVLLECGLTWDELIKRKEKEAIS